MKRTLPYAKPIETCTNTKIWLSSPHIDNGELRHIQEAFNMNWVAPIGPQVDGFENDLLSYTRAGSVLALSSGTSAIHLALILLGVKAGDEVICQSLTFIASANPILYLGATPVFVDSEKDTWNMCPILLRETIIDRIAKGKKPKAIIPVHLYGVPAKIVEIMEVAKEFDIPVLEDAAEALGSTFYHKAMGTFGHFGVLSFNGNKIITTSGGGALLARDKDAASKARFLATQACDPEPYYQHSTMGYNYRLSNISGAIGRGQMEILADRIRQRRSNFDFYKKALSKFKGISFVEEIDGAFSNRWLTTILIDPAIAGVNRETLRLSLKKDNIESRPVWKPMHLQPLFKQAPAYCNGLSEHLFDNGLCLPSGSNLSSNELERVVARIEEALSFSFECA